MESLDPFDILLILGLGLPALVALIVLVPVGITAGTPERGRRFGWYLAFAVEIAVLIPFLGREGLPSADWDWQWIAVLPIAGFHVAAVMPAGRRRATGRVTAAVALGALTNLILWKFVTPEPWPVRFVPGIATAALFLLLEPLASRHAGPGFVFAIGLATAGTAATSVRGGLFTVPIGVSALGMPLLVLFLLSLWRRHLSLAGGPLAVITPVLVAAPFVAWRYWAFSNGGARGLLFFAPTLALLVPYVARAPVVRRQPSAVRTVIVLVLIICLGVVGYLGTAPA